MSRSYKKNPFPGIPKAHRIEVKKAKKELDQSTRHWIKNLEELPQGNDYKKFCHSWQWHPEDDRHYHSDSALTGRKWWNQMGK